MAITAADLQAALGTLTTSPRVVAEYAPYGSTKQYWGISGGVVYAGKWMIIDTTASDNAATQATTITTALTGAANSDPYA
jgi:hypothetical protein